MEKPWGYHGEWSASGGPTAKTLGACSPSGFGLGTSLGTPFTMKPPRLFQIRYQIILLCTLFTVHCPVVYTVVHMC